MSWRLVHADCIEAMAEMDAASIDAIVTDPPYGFVFMGKAWDVVDQGWHLKWATEALRVLKPGGHLLAFGGTRTYHRLACAVEDAGFEIRDCLAWMYGSGFPKSLDVSKAIDKAAGAAREPDDYTANGLNNVYGENMAGGATVSRGAPATPDAVRWQGWGTALKPAFEPIVLARKPLVGSVASNVLAFGTGALNVDGTRIETNGPTARPPLSTNKHEGYKRPWNDDPEARARMEAHREEAHDKRDEIGRWPANVVLDPEAAAALDEQTGERTTNPGTYRNDSAVGMFGVAPKAGHVTSNGDTGGASRFFYCPKADREERDRGLEHRALKPLLWSSGEQSPGTFQAEGTLKAARNPHPTVKPVELMRWLCRLVTPPGGTVLDPFVGSGSTGIAALREGFSFIGIEREEEYVGIARDRIIGDAPLLNVPEEVTA